MTRRTGTPGGPAAAPRAPPRAAGRGPPTRTQPAPRLGGAPHGGHAPLKTKESENSREPARLRGRRTPRRPCSRRRPRLPSAPGTRRPRFLAPAHLRLPRPHRESGRPPAPRGPPRSRPRRPTLGRRGITVNTVAPGAVRTDMTEHYTAVPQVVAALEAITALGRIGDPEAVADVVAFLASPQGRHITGRTIDVPGGAYLGPIAPS
nr:SDR family oxidoreductase [Streptomyces leeuwenhoekii]